MDEKLIELVRNHEVLYNHSSAEYRDQTIRQEAWEEIGRHLQITGKFSDFVLLLLICINALADDIHSIYRVELSNEMSEF